MIVRKLIIEPDRHIYDLQEEFNGFFPFLTLNFFSMLHKKGEMSPLEFLLDPSLRLEKVTMKRQSGSITIKPEMTVAELEGIFRQRFGISVQVFRKCGNTWLETTATDGWTLNDQNKEGQALTEMTAK